MSLCLSHRLKSSAALLLMLPLFFAARAVAETTDQGNFTDTVNPLNFPGLTTGGTIYWHGSSGNGDNIISITKGGTSVYNWNFPGGINVTGAINASGGLSQQGVTYVPCDITGNSDCSSAVNSAIGALCSTNGGIVQLPAGIINFTSGITLSCGGVTLKGYGWTGFAGNYSASSQPTVGTLITTSSTSVSPITVGSSTSSNGTTSHAKLMDLGFIQAQPANTSGWTPTVYAPSIQNYSFELTMDNILFAGVYAGMQSGTSTIFAAGVHASNIFGTCFNYCIDFESDSDVTFISNADFNPSFYYGNPTQAPGGAKGPHGYNEIVEYMLQYSTAIKSDRNDDPQFNNVFANSYHSVLVFGSNGNGHTSGFQINQLNCDQDFNCINIAASGTSGQMTNVSGQSDYNTTYGLPDSVSFNVGSGLTGIVVQAVNYNTNFMGAYGLDIQSSSGDYTFVNINLGNYNYTNGGFTGIYGAAGNVISLSARVKGGAEYGGTGLTSGGATFHTSAAYIN